MKDYHTHLDLIDDDLDKIIERARKAGVNGFIVPGVCGFPNKLDELIKYPEIGICWGIYPKYAETDGIFERELVSLKSSDIDVVAIGECGLDKRFPDIEKQTALFKKQIDLANQLNKPLIVHLVGHFQLAYELLKTNLPKAGFTMHSWSGSVEMCAEFVKLGANISLSAGALKNPEKLKKLLTVIPQEKLFFETDSPDQKPSFWPAPQNEPAALPDIVHSLELIVHS